MECFVIFVMAWCWFNATESKPQNVAHNIFSELTQTLFLLVFRIIFTENCYRKEKQRTSKNQKKIVLKTFKDIFSDISNLMTILNRKLIIIYNRKPKNCVKSQILPKIGIRKLDKVVKSQILPKVGIMKLENQ